MINHELAEKLRASGLHDKDVRRWGRHAETRFTVSGFELFLAATLGKRRAYRETLPISGDVAVDYYAEWRGRVYLLGCWIERAA